MIALAVYYDGGTVDRFWVAHAGLSLADAKRKRLSRFYKTRFGAQEKLARLERQS